MNAMASGTPGLAKGFAPGSTTFAPPAGSAAGGAGLTGVAGVAPAAASFVAAAAPVAAGATPAAAPLAGGAGWRPFVLLATSRLTAFRERLHALLQGWCLDWGIDASELQLECLRAAGQGARAQQGWQGLQGGVWHMAGSGWLGALRSQMWQESTPNTESLAASATLAAHQDWLARLKAWPTEGANGSASVGAAVTDCFAPGSGAVLARLVLGGHACEILFALPAAWLPAVAVAKSRLPAPVPRSTALGKLEVHLQVEAGRSEVALGNLLMLAVGDVIRLDRSIDAPLQVFAPGGEHVFDGYLGKRGERKALELVPR